METGSAELSSPTERLLSVEWASLCRHRPNVLVFAPELDARLVIRALTPGLQTPLRRWGAPSAIPGPADNSGTLIIGNVSTLDDAEQRELLDWLSRRVEQRVQVVSVTPVPLFPLVERGAFLDGLYYRLNVVHLVGPW